MIAGPLGDARLDDDSYWVLDALRLGAGDRHAARQRALAEPRRPGDARDGRAWASAQGLRLSDPIGLTAFGAAATTIAHDPGHVVQPLIDELGACHRRILKGNAWSFNSEAQSMERIIALGFMCFLIAQSQEIRIDTYDKKSNRTGYIVIDPRTGRLDQFDRNSNRLGYGTTTPNPNGSEQLYDRNGRPVSTDRRVR